MEPLNVRTASVEEIVEAFKVRRPMFGIDYTGVHAGAHADELSSIATLRKYGRKIFIGIEHSGVLVTTHRWITEQFNNEDGKESLAWARAIQQGILLTGTGGGPFDEHIQNTEPSCLSLVVKFLGIEKNPELQPLLTYINYEDENGERGSLIFENEDCSPSLRDAVKRFMCASAIKKTWRVCKDNEVEIQTKFFIRHFEIEIEYSIARIEAQAEVLDKVEYLPLPMTRTKKEDVAELAITRSDNPLALDVILEGNNRPNLVAILQIESSGRFQLHSIGKRIRLQETAQIIRGEIFWSKNQELPEEQRTKFDWATNGHRGTIEGIPEIYFYQANRVERIFNGSSTQPDTLPTIGHFFSEDELIQMILLGLQDRKFYSKYQQSCEEGGCVGANCRLYSLGISRCRTNRYHLAKQRELQEAKPQ